MLFSGEEGASAGILKEMLVRCERVEGYYDLVVVQVCRILLLELLAGAWG